MKKSVPDVVYAYLQEAITFLKTNSIDMSPENDERTKGLYPLSISINRLEKNKPSLELVARELHQWISG